MTEQTKIPLPADGNPDAPAPETSAEALPSGTLIERAVQAFDLRKLASAPMPQNLAPPVVKPAARNHAPAVSQPVADVPEVAPVAREPVVVAPAPAAPAPVRTAPKPAPVRFTGQRHPVDREHLRDLGLIVPEGNVTGLLEEFRIVKRQLLVQAAELARQGGGAAAQRVLICSPHPGEGKTYCAVNLALVIAAEKESDVLLVDADFAKPSVLTALGLPGGPGLMDALADPSIDVAKCVIGTDIPGLFVLPAGDATRSDSEFLSTSRTRSVLDRLTEGAPNRMVIFDSPPALAASPAAELAKYVGQALVVARADRTGQGALEDAISLLSGCPNIQLLLNAVTFSPSGRKFGSYYGYVG